MGMLHAGADDIAASLTIDRNLVAMSVGGGAIGFLTPRAGVRFDLRHIASTSNGWTRARSCNRATAGLLARDDRRSDTILTASVAKPLHS